VDNRVSVCTVSLLKQSEVLQIMHFKPVKDFVSNIIIQPLRISTDYTHVM